MRNAENQIGQTALAGSMSNEDLELMSKVKQNDIPAFESLVLKHRQRIFGFALVQIRF